MIISRRTLSRGTFKTFKRCHPKKLLAIGGIHAENAGELTAVGGRGIAVSSTLCAAEDPAEATRALSEGLPRTAAS